MAKRASNGVSSPHIIISGFWLKEPSEAESGTGHACMNFIEEVRRTMGLHVVMLVGYETIEGVTVSK